MPLLALIMLMGWFEVDSAKNEKSTVTGELGAGFCACAAPKSERQGNSEPYEAHKHKRYIRTSSRAFHS